MDCSLLLLSPFIRVLSYLPTVHGSRGNPLRLETLVNDLFPFRRLEPIEAREASTGARPLGTRLMLPAEPGKRQVRIVAIFTQE